jgi:hypothetical protein
MPTGRGVVLLKEAKERAVMLRSASLAANRGMKPRIAEVERSAPSVAKPVMKQRTAGVVRLSQETRK